MNAPDLRIGRVVLRGTAPAVDRTRATLPATLARARWPEDESILVVRRVAVRGTPDELPARTLAAAEDFARRAADPWSPSADAADAVRFRDPLDYRACLVRDLLAGSASHRWLWRHRAALLARPPAEALAALLAEDALSLPALLDRPALRASLPMLWRTLDAPGAFAVLGAIGNATGWQGAIDGALDPVQERRAHKRSPVLPMPSDELRDVSPVASPLHAADYAFGSSTLRSVLPDGLRPSDPRVVLHAVLALWTHAPAALGAGKAGETLRAVAREFVDQRGREPETKDDPAESGTPAISPQGLASIRPSSAPGQPAASSSIATPLQDSTVPRASSSALTVPAPLAHPHAGAPGPVAAPPISSVAASPATLPSAADHDFATRGGGFFFLLNVLNLPALRDWRATLAGARPETVRAEPSDFSPCERGSSIARSASEPQAGWRELVRLARWMDFSPDPPLASFLADACALDPDDPLAALAALPPGADPAPLHDVALRFYGEAALRAALAERPARITATRSHLDVHLRLADVQLDIRRTGLDLDPGWLPWLGRVVHFHYDR